jgi:hypothetical protein
VYSALVVIAVWVAMIGIASRSNRLRSADCVPISFVSALSSVSLIAALLIQINAIHNVQRYGWLVALSFLAPVLFIQEAEIELSRLWRSSSVFGMKITLAIRCLVKEVRWPHWHDRFAEPCCAL